MPLGKLTKLERDKIANEVKELEKKIAELKAILASRAKIDAIIESELLYLKKKFGDERRTKITGRIQEISEIDLIHTGRHRGHGFISWIHKEASS